jgi:hypothetical protein
VAFQTGLLPQLSASLIADEPPLQHQPSPKRDRIVSASSESPGSAAVRPDAHATGTISRMLPPHDLAPSQRLFARIISTHANDRLSAELIEAWAPMHFNF